MISWLNRSCSSQPLCIIPHIARQGKDQNSTFQVRFLLKAYHFHTAIKSKNQTITSQWLSALSWSVCFSFPKLFFYFYHKCTYLEMYMMLFLYVYKLYKNGCIQYEFLSFYLFCSTVWLQELAMLHMQPQFLYLQWGVLFLCINHHSNSQLFINFHYNK